MLRQRLEKSVAKMKITASTPSWRRKVARLRVRSRTRLPSQVTTSLDLTFDRTSRPRHRRQAPPLPCGNRFGRRKQPKKLPDQSTCDAMESQKDQWRTSLPAVYLIWQAEWRAAADGRNGNRVVNNKPWKAHPCRVIAQHRPGKRNRLGLAKMWKLAARVSGSPGLRSEHVGSGSANGWTGQPVCGAERGSGTAPSWKGARQRRRDKKKKKTTRDYGGHFMWRASSYRIQRFGSPRKKDKKWSHASSSLVEALKAGEQLGLHTWKGVKLCQPFSCSSHATSSVVIGSLVRRESCRQGMANACVANVVAGVAWNPIGGLTVLGASWQSSTRLGDGASTSVANLQPLW